MNLVRQPIHFDPRWNGQHGIGRFSLELQNRLPGVVPLRIAGPKLSPIDPIACTLAAARLHNGCYLSPGFNPPLRSPVPFVFTVHDLTHLHVPQESTAVRRLYYRTVVRPGTRHAERILTGSAHARGQILEWSGVAQDKVVVVGHGVSEAFTPGPGGRSGPRYFLHVGRRAGHKNIPRLLAAYAASRHRAEVGLVFTGEADEATVAEARRLQVFDSLRFAGPISDPELAALYRGAEALLFPSLFEGFGLPIIESMACGTPVVTSSTTSMAEVASGGSALLVEPTDVGALRDAMERIVEDAALRTELVARGLARARDFQWERVVERVEGALRF